MTDWLNKTVPVPLVKVADGTAVFNGGSYTGGVLFNRGNMVLNSGEFYKGKNEYGIKTAVSGKNLSDYLGGDSLFWDSTSKVSIIDLSSVTSEGDVVVDLCEHSWDDGVCTVCKRVCGHQEPVDGKCPRCGLSMVASVDGKFYPDFASALEAVKAAGTCTLKLYTDFAYGKGQMNSNTLNYTKLTVDLNGYDLYGADGTSKVIQVIDGAELIVKDTSADRNGSVDNVEVVLGTTTGGKLTLESGAINMLTASPSGTVTLKTGAKVRYLTTGSGRYRFPVAALVPANCGLVDENGSWADLSRSSVGSVTGTGYYTVTYKGGDVQVGGILSTIPVKTPYGSNTVPAEMKAMRSTSWTWDAAKVRFQWYRTDGMYDVLTDYTATETVDSWQDFVYDKTTVGSGSGWADMTVGASKPLICVVSGLDADDNVLWCISSSKYTLTVGKGDLSAAEIDFPYGSSVVFNGDRDKNYSEGSNIAPYCTVTLYGKTLVKGTDYTVVSGDTATAVGDYTLTLEGTGDYTGTKTAEWHVTPAELKDPWVRGVTEKVYDGTNALPDGRIFSEFSTAGAGGFTVYLTEGTDFTISDAHYDTADVGEQKTIYFTVTLLNKNYTFDGGKTVKEFAVPGSAFVIAKAAAPIMTQQAELTVTNSRKATYTVALPQLPTAPAGTYGAVRYEVDSVNLSAGYYTGGAAVSAAGELTLPIEKNNVDTEGIIATVTVRAVTDNYEDILITVNVSAKNKITPTGTPSLSAGTIVYGTKLGSITLSGTLRDEGNNVDVPGTFSWSEPDAVLDAGSHQAEWTFTPNNEDTYLETSGTVQVTVNKADAACTAPTANDLTYDGTAQALVAAGSTADGEMQYSLAENGAYSTAIPTGTDAGTYTVWYKVIGDRNHNDSAARSVTVELKQLSITGAATIELENVTLVYTGQPLTQRVKSVTLGELNVTYTVSGNVQTGSGNHVLTVTGIGNFTGEAYARFDIHQAQLTKTGEPVVEILTYNGTAQRAAVTSLGYETVDGGKVTGLYSTEENGTYDDYVPAFTNAGSYTVYFKALASYHEGAVGSFTVTVLPRSIADAKIALGESLTYNGAEQTQSIEAVTVDGLTVTYDVTGNKQTNAGDYKLTVTGTGNFTGEAKTTFTIARKDMSKAVITLGDSLTYNGKEQTQSIESVTVDGLDVDYTVTGDKQTNAGDYKLTVTGTENFTGTAAADFTIARKNIADAKIELDDTQLIYNGEDQTKTVKSVTVDGLTVTYEPSGNRQRSAGTHTVTVTGNGNFTGEAKTTFTIAAKNISGAKITLGSSLTYNGKEQTQTVSSVVVDGLNASFAVTGNKQTNAGDYTLTVTGTGNFTGTETQSFTIARKDMSKAVITLGDSLTYNGKQQTQTIESVTVDGLTVTYDVTGDKQTNAGDYKLTVTGTGNFTGTAGKDYTIARKDIRDAVVDMNTPAYTGAVQTPVISAVRVDGMALAEGTDYTALLKDAVSAGSYSVQLTGTGNFTGTAERKFVIGKAAAPAVMPIRVDVTNDYAADYTVDLRAALNAVLPKGCSFGTVQYGAAQYSDAAGYCGKSIISGQGILTLAVNRVSSDTEGHAATVTVTVTTANYQDITVTVELYAVNKAVPTGTPSLSRNRLTYGETLSAIRLWGSMRSGNAWVGGTFTWAEPNLRPESGTYRAAWVFTPADDRYASVTGTVDITVAEPPATVPTYKVGGIVRSASVTGGTPGGVIRDAVVTIRKGLEVLGGQKITDEDGIFDLNGVTAGVYNVVVEYQGKTVTTKVEIVDHDVRLEVFIPVEDVNSQLEIRNPTALTDDVVVGGLDKEAGEQFSKDGEGGSQPGGGSVSVSMDIQEKSVDRNDDAQNAIRKELAGKSLQFISMDMTLVKNGVEQPLTETSTVLEIILSYDTSRRNITLARHTVNAEGEDTAEELDPKDTRENGTFYIDEANKCIHIFTNQMSTYAIGYTSYSGGSSQPVKSAETGDIGLLPYAAMTLSACTGVVVLRFRRKRED